MGSLHSERRKGEVKASLWSHRTSNAEIKPSLEPQGTFPVNSTCPGSLPEPRAPLRTPSSAPWVLLVPALPCQSASSSASSSGACACGWGGTRCSAPWSCSTWGQGQQTSPLRGSGTRRSWFLQQQDRGNHTHSSAGDSSSRTTGIRWIL